MPEHPSKPSPASPGGFSQSLPGLLLDLLWSLLRLLLPILLLAILPPLPGLALIGLLVLLMGLSAWAGWVRLGQGLSLLLTAAVIGFAFSVARWMASDWSIPVCGLLIVGGLALVATYEQRLGLVKLKPPPGNAAPTPGGSAWGGAEVSETPEGQPIRVFNHGEICMGGPTYCDYLFPDGVLLEGLGSSSRFSSDGRYFAAPVPSRNQWWLAIFDRHTRRLYRCTDEGSLWEIDGFSDEAISGRHSPLAHNDDVRLSLAQLLEQAESVDLQAVQDLWLTPDWLEQMPAAVIDWPSSAADHRVQGQLALPASLRELDDPLAPIRYPRYQLLLDAEPSGLLIDPDNPSLWRADGLALVCQALGEQGGYWYWQANLGWRQLAAPALLEAARLSIDYGQFVALDEQHAWLLAELDLPQPSSGEYGQMLHSIHSDTETSLGHDRYGQIRVGAIARTRLRIGIPLDGRAQPLLAGAAAVGGAALSFVLVDANGTGQGAYQCQIGDWLLLGAWQLEHRRSDCGRYLALLPACADAALAERVVVVDSRARRLLSSGPLLVERLYDFQRGRLEVITLAGLCSADFTSHPLRRCDLPAPPAATAAHCLQQAPAYGACHRLQRFSLGAAELLPEPTYRLVDVPQAANADGDFILPAPHGRDAAWLCGSETEYADAWLRVQEARQDGYLLTASGCALSGLTPSFCWSDDGRYLALTRLLQWNDPANDDPEHQRQWQLWLLDTQRRSLRCQPGSIGLMPRFEGCTAGVWTLRVYQQAWARPEDRGRRMQLSLQDLLALPEQALEPRGTRWHLPTEQLDAALWDSLDAQTLSPWRAP
ncbi:MAG: hypothetical protein Q8R10_03120 [Pseudomonas sp.]|uniref:hypothetical protein n=1 Tax=Pseudomonas sp. TaxID=306 RepID=UPI002733F3CE|nr:hypothetical protein [Pseudomonas sp.]MDP3845397.1 hypothetical protein [Pseudomonas sp.]